MVKPTTEESSAAKSKDLVKSSDFIRDIVNLDIESNKNNSEIITRFPPEPNGYLHIGHAKSAHINFGIAADYEGKCNLRFDDTNPVKEEKEYIVSIQEDLRWLGFDWGTQALFSSDYFDEIYSYAVKLIKKGKAYVCDLSPEQIRKYRGTLTQSGKNSPYRDRTVEENINLFSKMKEGYFDEGSRVLRAKIDMSSGNINLRDPVIYRILKASHPRTGDKWCIYPTYDFAHGQSDSIENVTHSICTIEFEDHRPLYDWFLQQLEIHHPQQIEFARLNLSDTVMSKRKLNSLVEHEQVTGWNDPRMPTISGMRRRGYTAKAIRALCQSVGVAKRENTVEMELLEHFVREDLNKKATRVMAVLDPLKVVIENYPEDFEEELDAVNNPEDSSSGSRKIPFSRELYIERDDFREDPPPKYFRLSPGKEVRLRYGFFIKCEKVVKNDAGEVTEVRCSYDPATRGGNSPDGRKVKGTIHWVSAAHAIQAEVRLYDRLLTPAIDDSDQHITKINPDSLKTLKECQLEPSLKNASVGKSYQFERVGYFCVDSIDSSPDAIIFNRTVQLRDSFKYRPQKS